jgi:metal-responsive CopG/Arc/MetJ family transcriptional regulator
MLDDAVNSGDTDRSKFIRAALREKLAMKLMGRSAAK